MKSIRLLALSTALFCTSFSNAQKYVGGDISMLPKYETNGAKYYDLDGNAITDMLGFFKQQNLNSMRLRLFVDPSKATRAEKGQGVCQDLDYVKALGKRIKEAGFSLILDFHYSDTWADPGKQWTPDAWTNLTDEQLYTKIYDYTKECLEEMKKAGAEPDFIQTGNEISYGMLWGKAVITKDTYNESTGNGETVYDDNVASHKKCYSNSPASNWTRFYQLLKKAGEACKEVCPNAKIILHTERVATTDYLTSYYQKMKDNGVNFDIMGLSYYPYFHGGLDQLEKSLSQLEKDHSDKDIMIVETNYYYVWQPAKKIKKEDKGIDYDFSSTWPITPAGQQAFTKALIEKLNSHSKVIGLYWWMMEACENGLDWGTKRVTDGWCNTSLFNDSNTSDTGYPAGKVMPAISELKNFLGSESGISALGAYKADDPYWYSLDGRRMNSRPQAKGIYLNNGKKIIINEK